MHRGGQAGEFKEITLSFRSRYSAGMLSTQYPFSFHKEPCVEASCPYIFISSLWRASKVRAEKRGSLWAQVSWAPHHTTFTPQYTWFMHAAPPQSVCCSYSLQQECQCWTGQRSDKHVCVGKYVLLAKKKKKTFAGMLSLVHCYYGPLCHFPCLVYCLHPATCLSCGSVETKNVIQ